MAEEVDFVVHPPAALDDDDDDDRAVELALFRVLQPMTDASHPMPVHDAIAAASRSERNRHGERVNVDWVRVAETLARPTAVAFQGQLQMWPRVLTLPLRLQRQLLSWASHGSTRLFGDASERAMYASLSACRADAWCAVLLDAWKRAMYSDDHRSGEPGDVPCLWNDLACAGDTFKKTCERLRAKPSGTSAWLADTAATFAGEHSLQSDNHNDDDNDDDNENNNRSDDEHVATQSMAHSQPQHESPLTRLSQRMTRASEPTASQPMLFVSSSQQLATGGEAEEDASSDDDNLLDDDMHSLTCVSADTQRKMNCLVNEVWSVERLSSPNESLSTPHQEAIQVLCELTVTATQRLCHRLALPSLSDPATASVCAHVVAAPMDPSLATMTLFFEALFCPKICALTQTASRSLFAALANATGKYPLAVVQGVLISVVSSPSFGNFQSVFVSKTVRETLTSDTQKVFCERFLQWLSQQQQINESISVHFIPLFDAFVNVSALRLSDLSLFVSILKDFSSLFVSVLPFGKVLLAFLKKYRSELCEKSLNDMREIAQEHKTVVKKMLVKQFL